MTTKNFPQVQKARRAPPKSNLLTWDLQPYL